ncbi:PRC-barrel domain-containing protein [Peteryoungia desertarenae]|uniref:PRC-barrel domain-containing protein n=1 Tax=Peteryoungia desertarenae TaxID=1813451 RepID=A0ABX6QRZ1_9HYPH|nr:PRC-barrel domain-containing protein [Peteryoungia desertarenae]QLF71032.1 PRC-barrel domain-containing protein [Peteryoungia desertarenae]
MKMIYVTALLAGTALAPATTFAQQQDTVAATQTQGQAQMSPVQEHIRQALRALDQNDLQAARQAVQEARRQLTEQAQNQPEANLNRIRQPLQEASQALSQRNAEEAEQALDRVDQQLATMERRGNRQGQQNAQNLNADVAVQEGEASIRVDVPEPDVTVRQPSPEVAVSQPQPEIIVRQPAPVVTVDIPQPQITVRMPQPNVNVSQARPQVQVQQGEPDVRISEAQPQVRVSEGDEQANVQVQRSGEPMVRFQESDQQPRVRYESEEAQVRVNRPEGGPEVRFEDQNQQASANREEQIDRQSTASTASGRQAREGEDMAIGARSTRDVPLTVSEIKDYDIVGANGNDLGDIEEVVSVNGRLHAVVTSGGFFGLGEDRAAIPLSSLYVSNEETLLAPNVSEQRIEGLANFPLEQYRPLDDERRITLGGS